MTLADGDEYHARMVTALAVAIFETSLIEIDGKKTAYIRTAEACEAMISVMGMLLEGAPNCQTPAGMRAMSEAIGQNSLKSIETARAAREASGVSPFGTGSVVN